MRTPPQGLVEVAAPCRQQQGPGLASGAPSARRLRRWVDVVSALECPHRYAHDPGCHYNECDSNEEGHAFALPWQRVRKRRARSSLAERSSTGPACGPYPCSVTLSHPWPPSGVEASFHLSSGQSHCQSDPQTGQCHRSLSRVARSGTVHRGAGLGSYNQNLWMHHLTEGATYLPL